MNIFRCIVKGRWVARRAGWPHREGWCTYHPRSRTVLDTGLTKDRAKEICRELNGSDSP